MSGPSSNPACQADGGAVPAVAVKERPILFSAPMVRALLDGSKTQTRRVVKPQPIRVGDTTILEYRGGLYQPEKLPTNSNLFNHCPYGQPGDQLIPAAPLSGYDKRYCVDVFGDVWSRAQSDWKRLKPGITSKGYCTITPARDGRYATQSVHRLVCEAFHGAAPSGLAQVRHLNGDQTDNAPENLDWGTQEQNWSDRAAQGGGMGESHHAAKLTLEDVADIRASRLSQRALASKFGVSQSTIQSARVGDHWADGLAPAPANMPRWASRILLEIVSVRVERLNDCSEADALAEGVKAEPCDHIRLSCEEIGCCGPTAKGMYAALWDHINDAGAWADNPWVWAISFKRVQP